MKNLSLRNRVTTAVALVAAFAALITGVLGMQITREHVLQVAEGAACDVVSMLAGELDASGVTPERILQDPAVRKLALAELGTALNRLAKVDSSWTRATILMSVGDQWRLVALVDRDPGAVGLYQVGDVFEVQAMDPASAMNVGQAVGGWYRVTKDADSLDWFGASAPLKGGMGVVTMATKMTEVRNYLLHIALLVLASLVLAVLVGTGLGWWVSLRIVRPIEQVRSFAASVDAGDFAVRLPEQGAPEIVSLMRDMNRMAINLGEREALLRRNKALAGEVRSHESRMAAFEAIEVDFAELGDLNLLMRRMLEGVVQVLPCGLSAVLLGDGNHMGVSHVRCGSDAGLARALLGQSAVMSEAALADLRAGVDRVEPRLEDIGLAALRTSRHAGHSGLLVPLRSGGGDLLGVLLAADPRTRDGAERDGFSEQDAANLRHFATLMAMSLERQRFTDRLLTRMIRMAETRDPRETGAHVKRVSGVSMELFEAWAQRHNLRDEDAQFARATLRTASMLHDVGKVGISDSILKKPGKLTDEEYAAMKRHTILGAALLPGDGAQDEAAREVALHHHERWDGRGYPGQVDVKSAQGDIEKLLALPLPTTGLKEYDIPLFARIVAIADVYDALSSPRAYKEAWPEAKVIETIKADAGKAFDPELVELFVERYDRIRAAWSLHPDTAHHDG